MLLCNLVETFQSSSLGAESGPSSKSVWKNGRFLKERGNIPLPDQQLCGSVPHSTKSTFKRSTSNLSVNDRNMNIHMVLILSWSFHFICFTLFLEKRKSCA